MEPNPSKLVQFYHVSVQFLYCTKGAQGSTKWGLGRIEVCSLNPLSQQAVSRILTHTLLAIMWKSYRYPRLTFCFLIVQFTQFCSLDETM